MPGKKSTFRRILGHVAPELFVGRDAELREITEHAAHASGSRNLLVLFAPFAGVSELLRQSYDRLFAQHGGASPIYFAFSRSDSTSTGAALRFLHTFLTQLIAHRRADATLLTASPTLRDLLELVAPSDYEWVERLVQTYERARDEGDELALVRACLSAPQQASARGARTLVMLDDLHLTSHLSGAVQLGGEVAQAAAQADVPFVLAGLRRRLLDVLNGAAERSRFDGARTLHLDQLKSAEARALVEQHAGRAGVALNDETRDLMVQQFDGSPYFITSLVQSALLSGTPLTSFREFQKLYVDELMGGRLQRRLSTLLEEIAPSVALRRSLLRVLHDSAANIGGKSPVEVWLRRLAVDPVELMRIMNGLHMRELASFHTTFVEASPGT
ncbi:MAG: hypothetical protein WCD76_19230, partial [Pyrinomonadaceae bacterium]